MAVRLLHWHEGMFLRPHHFQAAQRQSLELANLNEKWDQHHNWGLRAIELDLNALANHRFVVRVLKARMGDGTLVAEDKPLELDLRTAFAGENQLTVYLAVPIFNLGQPNVGQNGASDFARFLLEEPKDLQDENTGVGPQPIQFRLLNIKLLLSTEDHAGYAVLPIARVKKAATAEGKPELDETYIPPVLACDAWKPLAAGILERVYDRIGQILQMMAEMVVSRGISFDSQAQGDAQIFSQLRILNEAYALLGVLAFAEGVHPFPAYLELCRLAGQLAIFHPDRRVPDLPRYDHDDLGRCFYAVKRFIDACFEAGPKPEYMQREFIGAGFRMQVVLEPSWLEPKYQVFVGVKSQLKPEDLLRLLTGARPGLNMKIGSSERADEIFRRGLIGLRFAPPQRLPRALPSIPGLVYLQVDRGSQPEEWQYAHRSLSLAVRFNEQLILGNIENQRVITIALGTQRTTLEFILFIVPQEAKAEAKG